MIILHDSPNSDLTHIQAMAEMEEGFSSLDYVSINQQDGKSWIGQVIQPNRNISTSVSDSNCTPYRPLTADCYSAENYSAIFLAHIPL